MEMFRSSLREKSKENSTLETSYLRRSSGVSKLQNKISNTTIANIPNKIFLDY